MPVGWLNTTRKSEYEAAIRAKCIGCQKSSCPIHRLIPAAIGTQQDIFYETSFQRFSDCVSKVAHGMKQPFWWSTLRPLVPVQPVHGNWWGMAAKRLRKEGFTCWHTQARSKIRSRKGARDTMWAV